jgi:hypothetical protein
MSICKNLTFSTGLLSAAAPALVLGCSGGPARASDATVGATAIVSNPSSRPPPPGGVTFANGFYTGCVGHLDGSPWSVAVVTATGQAPNPALSVAMNDTPCALTLTSLQGDQDNAATVPFVLSTSFQSTPATFDSPPAGGAPAAVAFFANAALSSASFAGAFVITVAYTDDPGLPPAADDAGRPAAEGAAAESSPTAAPDYTWIDGIAVTTDATGRVVTMSGSASFTDGMTVADCYVISPDQSFPDTPTFAQDDTAFTAGTPVGIAGGNPQIDAPSFLTIGTDVLPQIRTVVFRHMTAGVGAYQTFKVTFAPPAQ